MNREFLELGQILIDFPLSYRFIKELTIREEANEHGTLFLQLVVDRMLTQEDILRLSGDADTNFSGGRKSSVCRRLCFGRTFKLK